MPRPVFSKRMLAFLCPLALCACMTANPRALYELSRFDPFNAEPDAIGIAVKTDRNLRVQTGDVELRVALESEKPEQAFDERFILAVDGSAAPGTLAGEIKPDDHVLAAAIAPQDYARFRMVQEKARTARAQNATKGKGTLSISVNGLCRTAPLSSAKPTVRSYMRTAANGDFFPLSGEMPLSEVFGKARPSATEVPLCEEIRPH